MRDGVQSAKEDWETGSRSALAGGVTVVIDQPNTIPPVTDSKTFLIRKNIASEHSFCHFGINAGVTPDADLEDLAKAGAMAFGETFAGPSSYGVALSEVFLQQALHRIGEIGGLLTVHAEQVFEGEDNSLKEHDCLRPAQGETGVVRMIERIKHQGSRIHYCHVSSAEALREIRKTGSATAEVTPHHLLLSYEMFDERDTLAKVNPPLRTEETRKELYQLWHDIDVVASDHAPHTLKEKSAEFFHAPSGIPGVQTMIPLLMAEVQAGRFTIPEVIEKTVTNPARVLGITPAGYSVGMRADFAFYPDKGNRITGEILQSKAGFTPFEGREAVFPTIVIMGGSVVCNEGEFFRGEPRWIQGRGFIQ
jgi:dihydroorotase